MVWVIFSLNILGYINNLFYFSWAYMCFFCAAQQLYCNCLRNPFSLWMSVRSTDGTLECLFLSCSHPFPSCYLCCVLHLAPQHSNGDVSVATWKVRRFNDPQCIHDPSPRQRTVSTPSTVPCQPQSKKKRNHVRNLIPVDTVLKWQYSTNMEAAGLLWGLVRSCSSCVQSK